MKTLKFGVYLTNEGLERVAKGDAPYPWHLVVRVEGDAMFSDDTEKFVPLAQGLEAPLPPVEVCVSRASAALKARMTEIHAEAYKQSQEVQQRLNDLLLIGHTPATVEETSDDIPF